MMEGGVRPIRTKADDSKNPLKPSWGWVKTNRSEKKIPIIPKSEDIVPLNVTRSFFYFGVLFVKINHWRN